MSHADVSAPRSRSAQWGLLGLTIASLLLIAGPIAACGKTPITATQARKSLVTFSHGSQTSALMTQVHLTIVAQLPGSPVDGPAYTPITSLRVPANTLVTFTIVNLDQGDAPLPAGSPFNKVTGVLGGAAQVDGVAYSTLAPDKVAHTFTLPGLGINVPIPGDAPAGHKDITVTFSFKTRGPASYTWQCMAPCGSAPDGFGGPMTMLGHMLGTMSVVG